ncbi:6-phosphofructokinase 1 [Geodermatophilus pulveris]|uniref:Pyrophosphate--fructose 6-phosphate 1-phosphotransferase n=1 Tax=Geodermatophilus pulveris TaxID=1564159 RepID=A0A239EMK0_9ACTN|nr:ATP-dependent 6-phosphofructokinase [Geodermatophilus pulveris]SNS45779.1 6-phosphofructokinase 1 [Geodermatophilus pulveris]
MRIGILTGGGDCPGLNAVIRAVVRGSQPSGDEVVGFRDGWRGVLEGDAVTMDLAAVRGILPRGGTVLGTSRTNPYAVEGGADRVLATLERFGIDALVPIGGEDTLGVAAKLAEAGVRVVGVPKTIDNDLDGTDYTFGFDTALGVATEAIDRLHTTGDSHHRTLVVEVMGRHAGWIALHAGMAGGATVVLIPELPFDVDAVVAHCQRRFDSGYSPIVVVSEGARPRDGDLVTATGERDPFGHVRLGGIGTALASLIEARTGRESRAVVLGHVQRGGTPSPFDRVLATRFGLAALDALHAGESGVMVALRGTDIVRVPLGEATARLKLVPVERYAEVEVFFG